MANDLEFMNRNITDHQEKIWGRTCVQLRASHQPYLSYALDPGVETRVAAGLAWREHRGRARDSTCRCDRGAGAVKRTRTLISDSGARQ